MTSMSTADRASQPAGGENLSTAEKAPEPMTTTAPDTELPVPRIDEDDFAPTIIRGRE